MFATALYLALSTLPSTPPAAPSLLAWGAPVPLEREEVWMTAAVTTFKTECAAPEFVAEPTSLPARAADAAPAASARADDLFPALSGDLLIQQNAEGEDPNLYELMRQYGRLTGQHVFVSEEARGLLMNTRTGLGESINVPAAEAQEFFEALLACNDFLLVPHKEGEAPLVEIVSLKTQARNWVKTGARYITVEQLEMAERHPAVMFTVVLELPNVDVRQLSNSMRTLLVDANTQQMLPAGSTDSMTLSGFGENLVAMANMLLLVNEVSAQVQVD